MEKINGQVTAVSDKGTTYGIAIGKDNWFNGKGKAPCKKGDLVDVTYELQMDPKYGEVKAIQNVYVTGSSAVPALRPGESTNEIQQMSKLKNQTNARICALTCAKDLSDKGTQPEGVKSLADQFLKWIEQ